jgi:hypothetical protein
VFGVPLSPGQPASFRCSVFFLKCFFFNVFGIVFKAFLCISQTKKGEFENGIKTFWKKYMSKTFYKKVEGENTFFLSSVIFSLRFVFVAFLAVSLHEEPQNTTRKIKPKNLQNRKKM